jgi:tRNA A-37 threonylcarbamoyl transferase component Bud32
MSHVVALSPPNRTRINHHDTEKYHISCATRITEETPDTRHWLAIEERMKHDLTKYAVFKGVLEKEKQVVIKLGPSVLQQEYILGETLAALNLPTFLRHLCVFDCFDNKQELFNKLSIPSHLCKKTDDPIHILVMPFIQGLPAIDCAWTRSNVSDLVLAFKHVVISLFAAFHHFGFIHGDLHPGNVLLHPIKKDIPINYSLYGELEAHGYLPVIMDYDMSTLRTTNPVMIYNDLHKYIKNVSANITDIRLNDTDVLNLLEDLQLHSTFPTMDVCQSICNAINKVTVKFVLSELP